MYKRHEHIEDDVFRSAVAKKLKVAEEEVEVTKVDWKGQVSGGRDSDSTRKINSLFLGTIFRKSKFGDSFK